VNVSDLTERELIARIQEKLLPAPAWLTVGIGDDAAVVEPERNRLDVLTVDAIVEGVHFDRRFTPPDAIGHRALAVNLSDLAAMGAAPRLALLSLALPGSLSCADFDAMIGGITALAAVHRVHVVGGNLTKSPGPLMIDVTASGTVKPRSVLTRSGARPGDEVYITGTIGGAAAGLQILQSRHSVPATPPVAAPGTTADAEWEGCVHRYLYLDPRVRTGLLLGRNRAASACMDLSDGLADGAHQIAEASGIGMILEAAAVPVDPGARAWFERREGDPLLAALSGGDDYELMFTIRPRCRGRLQTVAAHSGVPITRIGVCTAERGVRLQRIISGSAVEQPLPPGFGHFR
jgi:thiamine-monophosphate kinase